ncbi:hypothetical protein SO802_020504, partial [Lithocarpus litseifolius]
LTSNEAGSFVIRLKVLILKAVYGLLNSFNSNAMLNWHLPMHKVLGGLGGKCSSCGVSSML